MAIRFGKVEGLITVPAGGWSVAITETGGGGGPHTVTVPAGTYYQSSAGSGSNSLVAELAAQATANASLTGNYAGSIKAEDATIASAEYSGLVTLELDGGVASAFALTWTSTDLRDVLGFTGNLSGTDTYTGTKQARHLWLPDCPIVSPYGSGDAGTDVAASAQMVSPAGHVTGIRTNRHVWCWYRWDAVSRAKTRIAGETTTNSSLQKFWRDVIEGTSPGAAAPFGPVRIYPSASDNATYKTYKVGGDLAKTFQPEQVQDGWIELWRVDFDRVYEVPS